MGETRGQQGMKSPERRRLPAASLRARVRAPPRGRWGVLGGAGGRGGAMTGIDPQIHRRAFCRHHFKGEPLNLQLMKQLRFA